MNQGFATYYGGGLKAAAATLYKNKNWLKYYAYLLMNLLARITILPAVLFDLISVRQAQHAHEDGRLQLCASFRAAEKGKSLGTMLLVRVLEVLMLLAGVVIAAILGGVIGLCGALVAWKANASLVTVRLFFAIPPLALCALTLLVLLLFFAPSAYIVEKNPGFGMAGVLEVSFDTMRKRGAFTHFMHHFVSLLLHGVFLGALYVLYRAAQGQQGAVAIALVAGAAVLGLAYLVLAPLFTLAPRIADYCLLEDISLDPSNRAKHAKRVCISRSSVNDRDHGHDKKLLALFDSDECALPDAQMREDLAEAAETYEDFAREEREVPKAPPEPPREEVESEPMVEPAVESATEAAVEAEVPPEVEEAPKEAREAAEEAPKKAKGKKKAAKGESVQTTDDTGDDL